MDELQKSRKKIEKIDKKMAMLFEKRMHTTKKIGEYKKSNNLQVYDKARENYLLEKNSNYISNKELIPYYHEFLQTTMNISKKYQN